MFEEENKTIIESDSLSREVLQRLLRHFNQHSLKNKDLNTLGILDDAYKYLIKQFADGAGEHRKFLKRAGWK